MFDRILVANRGEIACRILRTCRRLGIRTVAVHSDADANARHVREADEAVRIGPASARASYLDAAAIVRAAGDRGADAIHPGYGFLSEKLELVDACAAAGIVFIGPHRDAIARMGSKIESKRIARSAGVACVPGYDGDDQADAVLRDAAATIGFPLLIKASAGGGGKGMKRVDGAATFAARLDAARGEALAAFGDDRVLLERYIERPRHLEVQLLGDGDGGLVHLFERECSIQRNYQKVIEEAPAHRLAGSIRERLFDAALKLGRAIAYDSAGTVEFVLDADRGDEPFFLEMNTRLQVEHPVTEMTVAARGADVDLVEQQIRSALGERLAFEQADLQRRGWAIEARVNAEVPDEDFAASFGPLDDYAEPVAVGLRVDSGVDGDSEVTPHYDAMLAKVIAHGATREAAKERLLDGIRGLRIAGVRTNQPLLAASVVHPAFDEVLTTRFFHDAFGDGWRRPADEVGERTAVVAAAWCFASRATMTVRVDGAGRPLSTLTGFRLTAIAGRHAASTVLVGTGDAARTVVVEWITAGAVDCRVNDTIHRVVVHIVDGEVATVTAGRRRYRTTTHRPGSVGLWCAGDWQSFPVMAAVAARREDAVAADRGDRVVADLPGVVTQVLVADGEAVTDGMALVVVEAMKLFHTLRAPRDGIVAAVRVAPGATVDRGAVLIDLAPRAVS